MDAEPIFKDLSADDPNQEVTEIESMCMRCMKNGQTKLLLTKIPFYKDVVIMSFSCNHCGHEENEIQSAAEIPAKGCKIILKVTSTKDLNRKIVKSDWTSVKIPEIDLEIPSKSQKGEITTVEGILERTIAGLKQDQNARRSENLQIAEKIDKYIDSLQELKDGKKSFTVILEDITGNAYVENFGIAREDSAYKIEYFTRTKEQNIELGIQNSNESNESLKKTDQILKKIDAKSWPLEELHGEVLQFETNCSNCNISCHTNMKLTNIPHFKEVVIMATICDSCGFKTTEVKGGGGIEKEGVKIIVEISEKEDLSRDVLKSETCSLKIPELDCEVGSAALGGRFTTVEGILTAMRDQLQESASLFYDSQDDEKKDGLRRFLDEIDNVITLKKQATLILDDPAGNSYVQSLCEDKLDAKLSITKYERTFEQNEELGLNDMKTENYN